MRSKRAAAVSVLLAALLVIAPDSRAAFPVVDLFNLRQAIERFRELQSLYVQGKAQLQQVQLQYQLALSMAQYLKNMPQRYRARFARWNPMEAPDTYGNTQAWIVAENLGGRAQATQGYQAATVNARTFDPAAFGQLPPNVQARIKAQYASINLSDGATADALATIGAIRARAIATQSAMAQLQTDSVSSDPALNTRAALLNKINVAGVMSAQSIQANNQLLAVLAEEAAVRQKERRDAIVRQLNDSIEFQRQFGPTMEQIESNMAQDQANFSLSAR